MLRSLLTSIVVLKILLVCPAAAEDAALGRARRAGDYLRKIRILEEALAEDPERFDPAIHEELRQLYGPRDARRSAVHADCILQHRVMDEAVLASLEGGDGKNPIAAAHRLIHRGHRWPDLPHLWAACSIRAAEKLRLAGRREDARRLLDAVTARREPTLVPYRDLAGK